MITTLAGPCWRVVDQHGKDFEHYEDDGVLHFGSEAEAAAYVTTTARLAVLGHDVVSTRIVPAPPGSMLDCTAQSCTIEV